jgi:diamine N-acetyltransferase
MNSMNPSIEVRMIAKDELLQVRELALMIFPFTYQDIVEAVQIEYMMDLFYTPEALISQWEAGQTFLIIYLDDKAAGYASYTRFNEAGDFKLNKIYLDSRLQGKGLGRFLLNDVVSRVKAAGGISLQLNVNRHNKAVGFYQTMGFSKKKEELLDIGNGYFMDDYVMELILKPKA